MRNRLESYLQLRVALAISAILLVIGGLLLNIVGDPPRNAYGAIAAFGILGVGCVFILAGTEAFWHHQPSRLTPGTAVRGLVVGGLLIVGGGLLVQSLYRDQRAFPLLISTAAPLVFVFAGTYVIAHLILARIGKRP